MITPLDPVIAQIIPLLPLRDPATMTPQSARDALRALAAARAAVPPPPVASVDNTTVKGAAGPLAARVYRLSAEKSPTVVFFHGGGWVAGDLETHDRQARLLAIETGAVVVSVDTGVRRKRVFPAPSRTHTRRWATCPPASPSSAATTSASA
jgi:acetyl esterase